MGVLSKLATIFHKLNNDLEIRQKQLQDHKLTTDKIKERKNELVKKFINLKKFVKVSRNIQDQYIRHLRDTQYDPLCINTISADIEIDPGMADEEDQRYYQLEQRQDPDYMKDYNLVQIRSAGDLHNVSQPFKFGTINIWEQQLKDPVLNPIIRYLGETTPYWLTLIKKQLKTEVLTGQFIVNKQGLIRQNKIVLPYTLIFEVIGMIHKQLNHAKNIMKHIQDRFYWPNIKETLERYIKHCHQCQIYKNKRQARSYKYYSKKPSRPNQIISMDSIGPLPKDRFGFRYINCIIDHFTYFMILEPSYTVSDKELAQIIKDRWIYLMGIPDDLVTDNGSGYIGPTQQVLGNHFKINRITITPGNSQALGLNEQTHKGILEALAISIEHGTYLPHWSFFIKSIQFTHNCTPKFQNQISPFELTFIRSPRLAIDNKLTQDLPISKGKANNHTRRQYLEQLTAEKKILTNQFSKYKKQYDKKLEEAHNQQIKLKPLTVGEPVMRYIKFKAGNRRKLYPRWETGYLITRRNKNQITYKIIDKDGRQYNEHRINLRYYYSPAKKIPSDNI